MLTGLTSHVSLKDLNPDHLKATYLRGLEHLFVDRPTERGKPGKPWPDAWWWWMLSKGVERIEEGANVSVTSRKRLELHDYVLSDYQQFAYIELWFPPVHSVTKVQAIYPVTGVHPYAGDDPSIDSDVILDFPLEWVRLYGGGKMHLVPTQGTLSQVLLGRGGSYLPMIYGTVNYLPQLWRIEYIGGFHNSDLPFIVADAVLKGAAIQALTVLSDTLKPPGATGISTNFDGVSRNYNFEMSGAYGKVASMFSSRLAAYRTELYGSPDEQGHQLGGMLGAIRSRYQGINMSVA